VAIIENLLFYLPGESCWLVGHGHLKKYVVLLVMVIELAMASIAKGIFWSSCYGPWRELAVLLSLAA
jgi:hypothetical protein